MSSQDKKLEDVLYSFSAEPSHDQATLKRYMDTYPEYAEDLLDALHEFRFTEALSYVETEPASDKAAQEAWNKFTSCKSRAEIASDVETFGAKLRGQAIVAVAKALRVPRSIMVALRDRLVVPASIPEAFVSRLASETKSDKKSVLEYLAGPPQLTVSTQFKSDQKPEQQGQVEFAELIEGTEMSKEDRQALLKDFGADGPQ